MKEIVEKLYRLDNETWKNGGIRSEKLGFGLKAIQIQDGDIQGWTIIESHGEPVVIINWQACGNEWYFKDSEFVNLEADDDCSGGSNIISEFEFDEMIDEIVQKVVDSRNTISLPEALELKNYSREIARYSRIPNQEYAYWLWWGYGDEEEAGYMYFRQFECD